MDDNILRVNKINKSFQKFKLRDVSFSIKRGTIMGFVGRNGSGKTTTLKSIYGLLKVDNGQILYNEKELCLDEYKIKNEIGLLFGGIDYFPNKKVKILTDVSKRFYENWDQKAYESWIKYFDIDENKRIRELSNGMKVKYNLAIALSHNAKLLLLDEPTSGLDPISRDEILDIFRKIVEKYNTTILFSTHVISDLDKVADDITYIKNGEIIYTGEIDKFKQNYFKINGNVGDINDELINLIGHYRTKNNQFEGTILLKDASKFNKFKLSEATLEDIILHIERGEQDEKSPL